jgi:hypothetical protein
MAATGAIASPHSFSCTSSSSDSTGKNGITSFGCISKGLGGYFISYRKLEQWIAACRTLIHFCPNLEALNALWSVILQEAQRYTQEALTRLEAIWKQRHIELSNRQQT